MILLYQFPFSHYCEKARWALDYKVIPYRVVDLLPGFHRLTVGKFAPKTCVPVLRDGDNIVQDSTAIIDYLDKRYPNPSLTPDDANAAREALEWEDYLDEEIGVTLRLWSYYHRLPDRPLTLRFLLQDAAWYKRPLFRLVYPKVRQAMIQHMNINADTASQAERRLRAAFNRLDAALDSRPFLVEDRFTRADLTACALLSRWCLPDDREARATLPEAVLNFRDELKGRSFYRWVRGVYETCRQPAACLSRTTEKASWLCTAIAWCFAFSFLAIGHTAAAEKEWTAIAALPNLSGVWIPDVKDQKRQETTNLPPWKPDVLPQVEHLIAEEKAGRPFLVLSYCLPHGMPTWMLIAHNALEILMTPGRITMLGEGDGNRMRRIYTDGRSHPEDPDPTLHGHSNAESRTHPHFHNGSGNGELHPRSR